MDTLLSIALGNPMGQSTSVQSSCCSFVYDLELREGILLGSPPEVVKMLQGNGELGAYKLRGIVLTDTSHIHGVSLWAFEFPVYKAVFVDGCFKRGERVALIGTSEQLLRARQILEITLNGPSAEQFEDWRNRDVPIQSDHEEFLGLPAYFAPLRSDGSGSATLDDFVEFVPLGDTETVIGEFVLSREGIDRFSVRRESQVQRVNLDMSHPPVAPFELLPNPARYLERYGLAARCLSYGNGFASGTGCTAWLLELAGGRFLVDAAPYALEMLYANGVCPTELSGVIITHAHEDHSDVLPVLLAANRLPVYTHPYVWQSLLVKFAALLDLDLSNPKERAELEAMFEFRPLAVRCAQPFGGGEITPFFTAHPIPCLGFLVKYRNRSLYFSGDTVPPKRLVEMVSQGVVSYDFAKWAQILHLGLNVPNRMTPLALQADLLVLDSGGDPSRIHPSPDDLRPLIDAYAERVVLGHRAQLPTGVKANLAQPGRTYVVDGTRFDYDYQAVERTLNEIGVTSASARARELLELAPVKEYPSGHSLCFEGQENPRMCWIVLAGALHVIREGKIAAALFAGDFAGEMAVLQRGSRSAELRAGTDVRVLEIPADTFLTLFRYFRVVEKYTGWSEIRERLIGLRAFQGLTASATRELIRSSQEISCDEGENILCAGETDRELYVILSGQVEVQTKEGERIILHPGDVFGEMTFLGLSPARTATVRAKTEVSLLQVFSAARTMLTGQLLSTNLILRKVAAVRCS